LKILKYVFTLWIWDKFILRVFIINLGQFEPKLTVNIRVEDLKQCVDPEESDVHNFTFSSEKKPYEVS
jgi:hypothetical protein